MKQDKNGKLVTTSGRDLFLYDLVDYIRVQVERGNVCIDFPYIRPHKTGFIFGMTFDDGHQIGEFFDSREKLEVFLYEDFLKCVEMMMVDGKTMPTFDDLLEE